MWCCETRPSVKIQKSFLLPVGTHIQFKFVFYRRLLILLPFNSLQKMFKAEQNKDSRSEEEETDLIEFSLFVA